MTDIMLPFQVSMGALRGRAVRLQESLDAILGAHQYPETVAKLLAENVVLGVLLAGSLKFDGIFTLQAQGDGAITLLVCDVTTAGDIRGYARYDADKLAALGTGPHDIKTLFGKGYLAFTIDQGADMDRYQGIVELEGETIGACAIKYFEQSEQIDTWVKIASKAPQSGLKGWQAAALMIQRMPASQPGAPIISQADSQEAWSTAKILAHSLKDDELLDLSLSPYDVAYRLFHGEGLQAWEPKELRAKCRCSEAKITSALRSIPRAEIVSLKDENGQVKITCEFCQTVYGFDDAKLELVYNPPKRSELPKGE